jgi:putative PIN family toxin of toxin-antitoxin system
MIIVLDTNMILSALFFGGMMEKVVDLIIEDKLVWFVSPALLEEVERKLNEFGAKKTLINKVRIIFEKGIVIHPQQRVRVCRDPEDNFILELAQECQADHLITRDKDLLVLPHHLWHNTQIVQPEVFLPQLRKLGMI